MTQAPNIFRFPGGKYRQREFFKDWLSDLCDGDITHFFDPFVGGGSVALCIAREFPNAQIRLNDLDPRIAAFWNVVVNGDVERLCNDLEKTEVTPQLFRVLKDLPHTATQDELALAAVYLNRTAFSGKSHTSPSGGWNQDTKWAGEHLNTKSKPAIMREWRPWSFIPAIREAAEVLRGRTLVSQCRFQDTVEEWDQYALYLDPPYYKTGKSMYPVSMTPSEHEYLAGCLRDTTHSRWVLSYDNCDEIKDLYAWASIAVGGWAYGTAEGPHRKNQTAKYLKRELVITR